MAAPAQESHQTEPVPYICYGQKFLYTYQDGLAMDDKRPIFKFIQRGILKR